MKTIIACLDLSDVTQAVARSAAKLAKAMGARLVLLHNVALQPMVMIEGVMPMSPVQDLAADVKRAKAQLFAIAEELKDEGLHVARVLREGDCVRNILAAMGRLHADMMVLGSHGHGAIYHLLMGGTAQEVIRKANCPVVVVRKDAEGQ